MIQESHPAIFLSYCWANKEAADFIHSYFSKLGLILLRDEHDINYTQSIKGFMNKVGKTDFVLMIISSAYIKSANCMYEVRELLNTHEFEKRILPVILEDASLFDLTSQMQYHDYWKNKLDQALIYRAQHLNVHTLHECEKIESIYKSLGEFFERIIDLKCETYESLKAQSFEPILEKVGINSGAILQAVIKISKLPTAEDRMIAIEALPNNYRENKFVRFQQARNAEESGLFSVAKKMYESVIEMDPEFAFAYNNLGLLLQNQFDEYDLAKNMFKHATRINEKYTEPLANLGVLLISHFNDAEGAKKCYEKLLDIDPSHIRTICNYANLLMTAFDKFDEARELYERAESIDSTYAPAYYNHAVLLDTHYTDNEAALLLYKRAIEADNNFAPAHFNLGSLLCELGRVTEGRESLKIAQDLDPSYRTPSTLRNI